MSTGGVAIGYILAFAFGTWLGGLARDSEWRANASQPMRVLSKHRFYKVRDVTDVPHSEWEWKP